MQDRVPLYPGRVKLVPVSGQENTYDMTRADQPTQEGTPLNKATFWADNTATLFGLGADSVPNEGFLYLGKYAQHWWRRRKVGYSLIKTRMQKEVNIVLGGAEIILSSEVDVDPITLNVSLKNEQVVEVDLNTAKAVLTGKYFVVTGWGAQREETVYIADNKTSYRHDSIDDLYATGLMSVTAEPSLGGWEYLQSSSEGDYPKQGNRSGYDYQYLGVPFGNTPTAQGCLHTSYVGTGTVGEKNPTSIAIASNKTIGAIVILGLDAMGIFINGTPNYYVIGRSWNGLGYYASAGISSFKVGKLSWYTTWNNEDDGYEWNKRAQAQLNTKGNLYQVLVFA